MTRPILVTGATGTVGGEVVDQLIAAGHEVRAAVHTPERARALSERGVPTVGLDYDDPGTWRAALSGVGAVLFVGWATPAFGDLSDRFATAAQRAGAERLVKLSAYGADFAPEFLIARFHGESERAIEATGIAFTHLRPNVFMQNLINYHGKEIRRTGSFSLAQGGGRVSFIDVRDVAAVAAQALTRAGHEGQAYTLTGSEALTYHDAARALSQASGRAVTYTPISVQQAARQAGDAGQPELLVEIGTTMDAFARRDGFARITDTFTQIIGRPPISLARFAHDFTELFALQEVST
jgi:uncharacterized protein YbjT (DUF2867 family)